MVRKLAVGDFVRGTYAVAPFCGFGVVTRATDRLVTVLFYSPSDDFGFSLTYSHAKLRASTRFALVQPGEFLALPPKIQGWLIDHCPLPVSESELT
jgi:hypothetical protein